MRETFFGSTFEPTTALLLDWPRVPGDLQLLVVEASVTAEEALDTRCRADLLHSGVKMVTTVFRSGVPGTVAKEVAACQGVARMAGGPSATLLSLPSVPGPGALIRLDVRALAAASGIQVVVKLDRVLDAVWCPLPPR